jgi:selenophosphate synthase
MSRKEILTRARDDLVAEQDKEIAAKILVAKNGTIDTYNKKMDSMLNDAVREYTEDYTKKNEAVKVKFTKELEDIKAEYNSNIKIAQEGTIISKEKNTQSEIDAITRTTQVQYASDIDNLTKRIDAIKE